MNKIKLLIFTIALFTLNTLMAQVKKTELHPLPQKITDHNSSVPIGGLWKIINKADVSQQTLANYENLFSINKSGKHNLEIRKISKKNPLSKVDGAYVLSISDKGVRIDVNADNGCFYAFQTIKQLVSMDTGSPRLPVCKIEDYPNVILRGTVEGFYGEPWSHADRLGQFKFYGKHKLNTYIYGPKDDPYHSSPNWRIPYPEKDAAKIRDLVEAANRNHVNFVWAIHPGKDIQWNKTDSLALISKFESMYQLGVRYFAVFFDDISGAGVNASKQAALMNYIQSDFLEKKKEVTPLIMCPTEYNKSWSNPNPGTYLDILGETLHPNVQVMWTGNTVVADITCEGLEWVNKRIKRNAFVWWNFPVSDYVRDHLLLGPSYGLDKEGAAHMSGFVANPMDKAEPSKVAVFSVAEYTWNMKSYDSQQSWKDACRCILNDAPEAFMCFAAHNSDPGHNWHRYRRDESVGIKPVVDSFLVALEKEGFPTENSQLRTLFDSIAIVPLMIRTKSTNKRLIEQIDPWLSQFELLGKAGQQSLDIVAAFSEGKLNEAWDLYADNLSLLNQMDQNDQSWNQNPYQPGVKTGSLVLFPFIKRLNSRIEQELLKVMLSNQGAKGPMQNVTSEPGVYTSLQALKNQSVSERKQYLTVTPILEVISLSPNDYIGLSWGLDRTVTEISFNLGNKDLAKYCSIQISRDGSKWEDLQVEHKVNQFLAKDLPAGICLFRVKSISKDPVAIRLNELKAKVKKTEYVSPEYHVFDNNLSSFIVLKEDSCAEFKNNEIDNSAGVTLFLSDLSDNIVVKGVNVNGESKVLFTGRAGLINIEEEDLKYISVYSDGMAKLHEVVWR